jgi:hypothetical protein
MATTIDRATQEAPERFPDQGTGRRGWGLWILSGAALTAVAVAAVVFFWPSSGGQVVREQRDATSLYTEQEQQVMQLVNEGQVPAETLQGGVFRIKSLVNRGLIPAETLSGAPVRPLYTRQELRIMALVAQGVLPAETLNGEPFRTKRLINQGLIPREAADPGPSRG